MIFVLDTNAISAMVSGSPSMLARRALFRPEDFGIPAIAAFEFRFGILKSARVELNRQKYEELGFVIVPFEDADAEAAAAIRLNLPNRGTPIGPYDILIAGQALARDLTLITRNTREFSRVEGLRVENWEA